MPNRGRRGNRLFVDVFLRSLSEAAGELLIADGLRRFEEGQDSERLTF